MAISRDVTRRAAAEPGRTAVVGPCGSVTFGMLAERARERAEQLTADGVGAGDTIEAADGDPVQLLVNLVAADQLEAVAVVTDAGWPKDVRSAALADARSEAKRAGVEACLAVFTSGSTGTPRPVVRSRRSWTRSFPAFSALTGIGADDTVLIPGRMSGSLFLYGALHALTMGAAIHPLPRWSPALATEATHTCTAVHVVPPMLGGLVERIDPATNQVRRVVCAGAQLDAEVSAAAASASISVVDYYGAAELSFVAIGRPGGPTGRMRAFPDVDVQIRDGVIWARSPYLALGIVRDDDGFATVGDHGERAADGSLLVHGRGGQAISTGGATVLPEAVERALRHAPGVADIAVVGAPHAVLGAVVVAVVEALPGERLALGALRAAAAERLPPAGRPRRWYVIDQLPRTGSGKVARSGILTALADGTLGLRALS